MTKKIKKIIMIIGIIVICLVVLIGILTFLLVQEDYQAKSYERFGHFNVEETLESDNGVSYLLISGRSNDSALRIKKVEEERDGEDVIVKVYTTLFSDKGGFFSHKVMIDKTVKRVLFGDEKKLIWEKSED